MKEITILCWGLFLGLLVLPTSLLFFTQVRSGQFLQQVPEIDFIYFYSMGRMFTRSDCAGANQFLRIAGGASGDKREAVSGLLAGLDWLDSLSLTGLDGQNLNEIGLKNGNLVVDDQQRGNRMDPR